MYSIRIHENSGRCGTIVRSNDHHNQNHRRVPSSLYKFQYYPLPSASSYVDVDLYEPVTDFCFGSDLALFACPRYYQNTALSPIFVSLEDGRGEAGTLRALNVQNFPQSDALRVEMTCRQHYEKYVAFGHRNGQVSLLDLRQSHTCCSILQHNNNNNNNSSSPSPLGSVTDLKFLPNNKQLLVKRSFGSCQLHDLRRTTSSSSAPRQQQQQPAGMTYQVYKKETPSSMIYNLSVPNGQIIPTRSATCNGLAVDPTCHQTMMSPYINDSYEACIGLWSLGTGNFVGSKSLGGKNPEKETIFVELCQKTTPSFTEDSLRKQNGSDGCNGCSSSSPSSFGVWLKCGRFSKSNHLSNGKYGSLHHLSFPGSHTLADAKRTS